MNIERLDSDRVLFLIWRFLLESNFRETAAKLQKEWQVSHPQRDLEWAKYVKTHALVALLQRGLQHNALEREFLANEASHDSAIDVRDGNDEKIQEWGVFGPLVTVPAVAFGDDEDDEDEDEEDFEMMDEPEPETQRKRPADRRKSSPAKRQRLSNHYSNGMMDASTAMDIDQPDGNGHAYPSPLEGESAPLSAPRTDGPAVGVQAETVRDMTPETVFLELASQDTAHSRNAAPPMLLHCSWNPQNPTMLAAAGTDALARIWTVPTPPPSEGADFNHTHSHVTGPAAPASELILSNANLPADATVTAMAWNHEGDQIAVATHSEGSARVTIYGLDSAVIQEWELGDSPVLRLKWNAEDSLIVTISPEGTRSLLSIFPVSGSSKSNHACHSLDYEADRAPLDVEWCAETEFIVCGGSLLKSLRFVNDKIELSRKFETRDDDELAIVQFNNTFKLLATGSDNGQLDIWNAEGQRTSIQAHIGVITSLAWRPSQSHHANGALPLPMIASAGEDGKIFIWNAKKMPEKPEATMKMPEEVVALSFAPDGSFIAGACEKGVLVWKVGGGNMPYASWTKGAHPGWLSPKPISGELDGQHVLCWDPNGHKLAYGVNSRLAVINFNSPPSSPIHHP